MYLIYILTGCMLCLGRSNYFRFNHPQEAKYMKSVLPNTRVSIMPNAFCPSKLKYVDGTTYFISSYFCSLALEDSVIN